MQQGLNKDVAQFICYGCSYFATTLQDLNSHVKSQSHTRKKDEFFRCESCNLRYLKYWQLELHCYTTQHFKNYHAEYAGLGKPEIPVMSDQHLFCPFCKTNKIPDDSQHLVRNEDHIGSKQVLDDYLICCQRNQIHPVKQAIKGISVFRKQYAR